MTTLFHQLSTGDTRWAVQFAGQGSPWRSTLDELIEDPRQRGVLAALYGAAERTLAPVLPELTVIGGGRLDLLGLRGAPDAGSAAHVSVPGILLSQYGAYRELAEHGATPSAVLGHSQGVLARAMVAARRPELVLAVARLIGAAATTVTAARGARPTGEATPMLAVRGVDIDSLRQAAEETEGVVIGIINGHRAAVASGLPEALLRFRDRILARAAVARADREAKRTGGQPPVPVMEFLDVTAPFHDPLLEEAVDHVDRWAERCGIAGAGSEDLGAASVHTLSRAVLTDQLDWPTVFSRLTRDVSVVVDLGPGTGLKKLTTTNLAGTGRTYVAAGTAETRDRLLGGDAATTTTSDWSDYAPALRRVQGRVVLDTAFSRLTGRSPIMLGGMTPTTVDPEIVAAAANAGYWAELGGGGQVSEEVLTGHLDRLAELLEPGRTAQFNAMFLDRYLWDLHFGGHRLVSRARLGGAPLDGVTISAGIPDIEEATQLVARLRDEGFPYIAFKPGTVDQIRQTVAIARACPGAPLIVQVEDGHAGGHHSWEGLDDLLLATYAEIRDAGLVLAVGGGLGDPAVASSYLTGAWSRRYGLARMPVDAVFVGTVAMTAKEARTTPDVKELLVRTSGIAIDDEGGWVAAGASRGGITSTQSSLHADMYNVENSAAKAARLLLELDADPEQIPARRDEIIAAIGKTAKPYFGDIEAMTYEEMLRRFVELSWPRADEYVEMRFHELLQRVEARLSPAQHGEVLTLFPARRDAVADPQAAIAALVERYPRAAEATVLPADASWFVALAQKYPKPVPFVPIIDDQVLRLWGSDSLWQSQDPRYSADEVRIIPGPVSVASITSVDEPIADILARFEDVAVAHVADGLPREIASAAGEERQPVTPRETFSRSNESTIEALREAPFVLWHGHLTVNPASVVPEAEIIGDPARPDDAGEPFTIQVPLDTTWDGTGANQHVVTHVDIPLEPPRPDRAPIVDDARLADSMRDLLAAMSGVGATTIGGTPIAEQPPMIDGVATLTFDVSEEIGALHAGVTHPGSNAAVPSALLGSCWPTIYSAMGSGMADGYPIIEGLLSGVHLDHSEEVLAPIGEILRAGRLTSRSWVESVAESSAGRVLAIRTEVSRADGEVVLRFLERFAMRGRATTTQLPADPAPRGGTSAEIVDTPRSVLGRDVVTAPQDMTAFAIVSGDYNPIHVSRRAARIAGMEAPLVHGMWLCAAAQHVVTSLSPLTERITGWTYRMVGMVNLGDDVEVTVERVGRLVGGGLALEVTCRCGGEVVSMASASVAAPTTAYVYPGQGIQARGMALDERADSVAAREVWERADRFTRERLGFSIMAVVRDNPSEITVEGTVFRHPEGVLNLTQFTQVALATVAMAQTARLRERGALVEGAYFAGHSLGEYDALAAYAHVMSLENVLEIVYRRGSAMHHLVPRDSRGRSTYRMGALRPNQFGVGDDAVADYIEEVSVRTGEFLEIANYNLAGQQYAIAGTVKGLEALAADSARRAREYGGKRPFMFVPGIDVPFHSAPLRGGVDDFRDTLDATIPRRLGAAVDTLVGRYIPNLVARPFELTEEFCDAILGVVPSSIVRELKGSIAEEVRTPEGRERAARILLIELLAWQFASPVRWIESQQVLLDAGTAEIVEVGLGESPTLANLAQKTLRLPENAGRDVTVLNVQRDADRVFRMDQQRLPEAPAPAAETPGGEAPGVGDAEADSAPGPDGARRDAPEAAPGAPSTAPAGAAASGPTPEDLPFRASDALVVLLADATKMRPDQIADTDSVETLTNGVSSKRNQILMDMTAELELNAMDGVADATIADLRGEVDAAAHSYRPFGPVLSVGMNERLRALTGAAGKKLGYIADQVADVWGLGAGWAAHTQAALVLGTRDGKSTRGEELATLSGDLDALIDAAVAQVAEAHGIQVAKPRAEGAAGAMVDSAALDEFRGDITGVLADTARDLLARLGESAARPAGAAEDSSALRAAMTAELGDGWEDFVAQAFDPEKAVRLCDRWATAREDVARIAFGKPVAATARFEGTGAEVAAQARWQARRNPALAGRLENIARAAEYQALGSHAGEVAVVTGVAPGSIAASVAAGLLAEGATVIATASRIGVERLRFAKTLYREHARNGAELWLVPANLASFRDIDALVQWIATEQRATVGGGTTLLKPALIPDLLIPFAAGPVAGYASDAGPAAENQARVLLWGVERLVGGLAEIGVDTAVTHRMHVVLPGSPNRGKFGGDGAYGEAKSALDALVNKWRVEPWGGRTSIAHARIGWVRGTGLMGANDPLVAAVEETGVRTWSAPEAAEKLLTVCTPEAREAAAREPIELDMTGGLDDIDLSALTPAKPGAPKEDAQGRAAIRALPFAAPPRQATMPLEEFSSGIARPEDMIVLVGIGELGPWGTARTRLEAELGIRDDGDVDLTPVGVLELAWLTGLVTWHDTPKPGWYDADGQIVDEADIFDRYRDEVVARCGIRAFVDDGPLSDIGTTDLAPVYLERDITFPARDEAEARDHVDADPEFTTAAHIDGEWQVTRRAGATTYVPRRTTLTRRVGGQFPTGFDPARWGIPASLIEGADRMAAVNLVTAVDAFLSAGFSPAELMRYVHPLDVTDTQGTGFGGMTSMRRLFVDRFLGRDIPMDILQEVLPNVIAAHTMQSYIGGYGSMIHPVGACATAAVSVEEGVDKIRAGKASFVVAGGIDDVQVESLIGFGNMNATADSFALEAKGIHPRFFSRPGDLRRSGFVEGEGGGTVLLARGDLAAEMGLPVYGVVGYVRSFADGVQSSIPAPGLGALGAARGGADSQLSRDLAALGVTADDIAVLSKHDTSTNANDPNEATLHERLFDALGREPGNPLYVISQKSLTGHSKGGAALFQISGLAQVFSEGIVPGNKAVDCQDPVFAERKYLVWPRQPVEIGDVKAAILTSLGFGHVSALVVLAHPAAFEAALARAEGAGAAAEWRAAADRRLAAGARRLQSGMIGHAPLFEAAHDPFADDASGEEETAMLFDLDR